MDPVTAQVPPKSRSGWTDAQNRALALALMITGAVAAIGGYVTMNTQLVLAYRGGTLANVHALCSNALVQALAHSTSECSAINANYTFASIALYGGLVLAGIGLLALLIQRRTAS